MIKKTLFTTALLANTLYGQWFIGVDYVVSSSMSREWEMTTDQGGSNSGDDDFEYKPLIIKLGNGTIDGSSWSIYYSSEKLEFDNGKSEEPLNEFGFDYLGSINIGTANNFVPFYKLGINTATFEYTDGDASALGVKVGLGVNYNINSNSQFTLGVDYKYRQWEDKDFEDSEYENGSYYTTTETLSMTDSGTRIYIGFNYYFGSSNSDSATTPSSTTNNERDNNSVRIHSNSSSEVNID